MGAGLVCSKPTKRMMKQPVKFAVVGVGNFARSYLKCMDELARQGLGSFEYAIVRNPAKYTQTVEALHAKGVRILTDYEEALKKCSVDVMALPTPIYTHAPMAIAALQRGFHVLVEKPPAATVQDIDAMISAQAHSRRLCQVGWQLITGTWIQEIKRMVCAGELGEIIAVVAEGKWRRSRSYYRRTPWAGKLLYEGSYVLDGPINNPLAHILNNELFVASPNEGELARPLRVWAEMYRGHPYIDGENTSCIKAKLDTGAELYFFGTLCSPNQHKQRMRVVGTKATAHWQMGGDLVIERQDGVRECRPGKEADPGRTINCFTNLIEVLRGEVDALVNPIVQSRNYVLTINAAYESAKRVRQIPVEYLDTIGVGDDEAVIVRGIESIIDQGFEQLRTFSDIGVAWARPAEVFEVGDYDRFDLFRG